MSFENKVVIITGGAGGIGKATTQRFLASGANVVLNGRRENNLADAAKELDPSGQRVAIAAGDINAIVVSARVAPNRLTGTLCAAAARDSCPRELRRHPLP